MPPEKRYGTSAEKQKAYRDRKRQELVDPELPARDIDEDPSTPPVDDAMPDDEVGGTISLADYVALTEREAAAYADSIGETDAPYEFAPGLVLTDRRKDRIKRAGNYARWRYQGVLDGEVERL